MTPNPYKAKRWQGLSQPVFRTRFANCGKVSTGGLTVMGYRLAAHITDDSRMPGHPSVPGPRRHCSKAPIGGSPPPNPVLNVHDF